MDKQETFTETHEKKRVYLLWKEEGAIHREYKEVVRIHREKMTKAEANLELNLATVVKDNKIIFRNI